MVRDWPGALVAGDRRMGSSGSHPEGNDRKAVAGESSGTAALPGVAIHGYVLAESGVGEHTRLLVDAVRLLRLEWSVSLLSASECRQGFPFVHWGDGDPNKPVTIIGANADCYPEFARGVAERNARRSYLIALWAWELESFPRRFAVSARWADEIWANSSFSAQAISKAVSRPVFAFPLPIKAPPVDSGVGRAELGLETDEFLFLSCFDFASSADRKNPEAAIVAFGRAFPLPGRARLVVKCVGGHRHPSRLAALRSLAASRPDIEIREGYLRRPLQGSLMAACDCFVSLHRSEGFGLLLGEAMALGRPVIATGYSGNLDFMTPENSFLVDWTYGRVPAGCGVYEEGERWAEPDIEHAAELMRLVVSRPDEAKRRAELGRQVVLRDHGLEARARFVEARLREIASLRSHSEC